MSGWYSLLAISFSAEHKLEGCCVAGSSYPTQRCSMFLILPQLKGFSSLAKAFMCCRGWGKQVRWCRHNGHFKKCSYQPAAMGKEVQIRKSRERKRRWKEGLMKKILVSKLLWCWQSAHLQQEEHKCLFSPLLQDITPAMPGTSPTWLLLTLPSLPSSQSWTQVWEKLKIGLTMNICHPGAVRTYLRKVLLSPSSSLAVERCWRAPTAFSCREERIWETRFLSSLHLLFKPGGVHWKTWHKDWCLA